MAPTKATTLARARTTALRRRASMQQQAQKQAQAQLFSLESEFGPDAMIGFKCERCVGVDPFTHVPFDKMEDTEIIRMRVENKLHCFNRLALAQYLQQKLAGHELPVCPTAPQHMFTRTQIETLTSEQMTPEAAAAYDSVVNAFYQAQEIALQRRVPAAKKQLFVRVTVERLLSVASGLTLGFALLYVGWQMHRIIWRLQHPLLAVGEDISDAVDAAADITYQHAAPYVNAAVQHAAPYVNAAAGVVGQGVRAAAPYVNTAAGVVGQGMRAAAPYVNTAVGAVGRALPHIGAALKANPLKFWYW
jgi:hypothetical protein